MKTLCECALAALILGATLFVQPAPGQEQSGSSDVSRARLLWNEMIAAKGGREKLNQVSDLVVRMRTDCPTDEAMVLKYFFWKKIGTETLWVFPDRSYFATLGVAKNAGDANFNLYNGDARGFWSFFPGMKTPREFSSEASLKFAKNRILWAQIMYLGETRWVKPVPIGYTRQRIHLRAVDVVRTRLDDTSTDFYLDRQTHLPLKVETNLSFGGQILHSLQGYVLSDYTSISGVRFPLKMAAGSCRAQVQYEVNASYDPSFFEGPPKIQYKPEPWREMPSGNRRR